MHFQIPGHSYIPKHLQLPNNFQAEMDIDSIGIKKGDLGGYIEKTNNLSQL